MSSNEDGKRTRSEIHKLVWSQPMFKVAPTLGITDRGLAKLCDRHKIPYPWRGYWLKVAAGRKPKKLPLPPAVDGVEEVWILSSTTPKSDVVTPAQALAKVVRNEKKITVPKKIPSSPHRVTRILIEKSLLESPLDDEFQHAAIDGCVGFSGTVDHINRAISILNTIVRDLDSRGFLINADDGTPRIEILGEQVTFRIYERLRQEVKMSAGGYRSHTMRPSGELILEITVRGPLWRKRWRDSKSKPLEKVLNDFVAGLILATDAIRQQRIWDEEQRIRDLELKKQREEEARKRQARELKETQERHRAERLELASENWRLFEHQRKYVEAVRAAAMQRGIAVDESTEVGRWLLWSAEHLARRDPLGPSRRLPEIELREWN